MWMIASLFEGFGCKDKNGKNVTVYLLKLIANNLNQIYADIFATVCVDRIERGKERESLFDVVRVTCQTPNI